MLLKERYDNLLNELCEVSKCGSKEVDFVSFEALTDNEFSNLIKKFNGFFKVNIENGKNVYWCHMVDCGIIYESESRERIQMSALDEIMFNYNDFENRLSDYEVELFERYFEVEWKITD